MLSVLLVLLVLCLLVILWCIRAMLRNRKRAIAQAAQAELARREALRAELYNQSLLDRRWR